jgi:hypothetical protein
MQMKLSRWPLLALASLLLAAPLAWGTTVMEMNLASLTERSEKIFRGTVLDVSETSVEAGGGTLQAVKYTIRVDETFKGSFPLVKGESVAEILMVGSLKQYHAGQPPIAGFPLLDIGSDYLLMVAPPGPVGLTTTMGLGQGAFAVYADPATRELMALNGFNNASLFKGMGAGLPADGPVAYDMLVAEIQAQLSD